MKQNLLNHYIIFIIIILLLIVLYYNNKSSKDIIHQIADGIITIRTPTQPRQTSIDIIVYNEDVYDKVLSKGELGFGESYMDGDWNCEDLVKMLVSIGGKYDQISEKIKKHSVSFIFASIKNYIILKLPSNNLESSKNNISSHYDAGNDLFHKMLDKNMQYTCAYYNKPNMTLDQAQEAKMNLIAHKLGLKPGMSVLDIGCGFGSLAKYLADKYGVYVDGVTLSEEQKKYADKHFSHPNVKITLLDYRHVKGQYDRVYSIGMFEHVGHKNYQTYFDKCYQLLKPNGVMLLHTIATNDISWKRSTFYDKYIFPEGELPNLIQLSKVSINKWNLEDFHNFGLSYGKTLRAWRENIGDWSGLERYPDKFRRMWIFYLSTSEAAFVRKDPGCLLWQLVYTKRDNERRDNCNYIRTIE